MSADKSPNDIGASYVCAYCGEPMIETWKSCCGEVHWVEADQEDEAAPKCQCLELHPDYCMVHAA